MTKYPFQQIASKWLKTIVLYSNEQLSRYIPETKRWQPDIFFHMLSRYHTVFLKPDKGGGGFGIISVEALDDRAYEVRYGTTRQTIHDKQTLLALLKRRTSPNRRYLIQRGIPLATVGGRPFDIRIIVQRPNNDWRVMGMAAKVAAKEKIVTNRSSGGIALTVNEALRHSFHWDKKRIYAAEQLLTWIALETAHTLTKRFPRLRILGLDVGIDRYGHPWIFEVNTRPQFQLFRQIDFRRYRHIIAIQRKIINDARIKNNRHRC